MSELAKKLLETANVNIGRDTGARAIPQWNHRVLIVEDESAIADAYRDILGAPPPNVIPMRRSSRGAPGGKPAEAQGATENQRMPMNFELTIVRDAEKAIAEVKHALQTGRPFTMGFFDVLLGGGMDGIELVKKLHEIDPEIYAVFVTAYSDRGVDSIATFLGEEHSARWDYLNKPFTKGEILQKARNAVTMWNLTREREMKDEHLASMQKQLLERERYASVAAVARGIAHEFRNILTQITGKAELGMRQGDSGMRESLNQISTASMRAAEILKRFNFLSNPNEQKVIKKHIYLDQPIEEALMLLSHQLKMNNVKICWIRRKKVLIHANATSLMQVFVNLLINAMHAMGSSGQIDISVTAEDGRAEVRFRDYGPGIPEEIIYRVTEPFFTTKGENGTGLGLAIAKGIIETEHEGNLSLANHEVKGLEVIIQFPVMEAGEGENVGSK